MLKLLDRAVAAAIGLIAAALLVTAFGQVIARYVFARPFTWVLEFDVVLLSIVRTDARLGSGERESALNRKYGFLRLANRLNVAMSRQRRLLIAIGDAALARAAETAEAAPGLADFMRLCESEHGRVL